MTAQTSVRGPNTCTGPANKDFPVSQPGEKERGAGAALSKARMPAPNITNS